MNKPSLNYSRLAMLLAAAYAPCAFANVAARIEFATGDPVIVAADGRERPARKGEQISVGDRVLTRAGRAQLLFTDGGFVSLQPDTDFGVNEYHFKGSNDGSEKGVFSLLKGALRTVTGLIGRTKREAYLMNTPTATIGIRGTGGRIEVNERGTFIAGTSGIWYMLTSGGSIDVPAGARGFAGPDRNEPPQLSSVEPSTPPVSPPVANFVAPEQVNSSGDSTVIGGSSGAVGGSGYAVLHLSDLDGGPPSNLALSPTATTVFSGSALVSFTDAPGNTVASGSTGVADSGNDGVIGWGRWTNGAYTVNGVPQTTLNASQGLHYVVGIPTAMMPTGGAYSYGLLGATTATYHDGSGNGTFALNVLQVDFNTAELNISFQVNFGGGNVYTAGAGGIPITGSGVNAAALSVSGTGSACGSSAFCTGSMRGQFFGVDAARLGVIYSFDDSFLNKKVNGGAAFEKLP